jgi:hypothetical protein
MLERADSAVQAVRKQIPMRGNVQTDIDQTHGDAHHRAYATRTTVTANLRARLQKYDPSKLPDGLTSTILAAASAKITGAGNCEDFRAATLLEAGERLESGEQLVAVVNDAGDHTFVQMESKRRDGTTQVVVLDAWANGPAVLAQDCPYAQMDPGKHLEVRVTSKAQALAAKKLVAALVNDFNKDGPALAELRTVIENRKKKELEALQQGRQPVRGRVFSEEHVTGEDMIQPLR